MKLLLVSAVCLASALSSGDLENNCPQLKLVGPAAVQDGRAIFHYTYQGASWTEVHRAFHKSTVTVKAQSVDVDVLVHSVDSDISSFVAHYYALMTQNQSAGADGDAGGDARFGAIRKESADRAKSLQKEVAGEKERVFSPFGSADVFVSIPEAGITGSLECTSTYDQRQLAWFIGGLAMVCVSRNFAESVAFQYFSGVSVVMFAQFLIVFIILYKIVQNGKKTAVYSLFVGTLSYVVPVHFFNSTNPFKYGLDLFRELWVSWLKHGFWTGLFMFAGEHMPIVIAAVTVRESTMLCLRSLTSAA